MKINSKTYNYIIDNFSIEQLEKMVNKKKKEIYKTKLSIAKKSLMNQKLDF